MAESVGQRLFFGSFGMHCMSSCAAATTGDDDGQKQAGQVWNEYLVEKLISLGYKSSMIDDCVFFRGHGLC